MPRHTQSVATGLCTLLLVLFLGADAADAAVGNPAAQPRLADEQVLFNLSGQHLPGVWEPDIRHLSSLQVSPDGVKLLYVQRLETAAKPEEPRGSRLVLRDLATGRETILPVPPVTGEPYVLDYLLTGRLFDPTGKRIVLGVGIPAAGAGATESPGQKDRMRAAIYDIASAKLQTLDLEGPAIIPSFDSAGTTLLALSYDLKTSTGTLYKTPADKPDFKPVETLGLPRAPCPGADLVALVMKREKPQQSDNKLVLYDLKTGRIVQEPTATGPNWDFETSSPVWTTDGRYLCYRCGEKVNDKYKWVTRIWDRTTGKVAADLEEVYPIGPGPTPTTLVMGTIMAGNNRGIALYDAATGKSEPVAGIEYQPMAAGGGKVFYIRRIGDDNAFCSARITAE